MKKLLILLLLASPAFAATTPHTINITDAQSTSGERDRVKLNTALCVGLGLNAGCNTSGARNAFCTRPGSSGPAPCTVNGVSSSTINVYATLDDYLDKHVVDVYFADLKLKQNAEDLTAVQNIILNGTNAQKNAVCAALVTWGFPSTGCLP